MIAYLISSCKEIKQKLEFASKAVDKDISYKYIHIDDVGTLKNDCKCCLYVDHKYISFDWIELKVLERFDWVLISDDMFVHHKTLIHPPIDYIIKDLPIKYIEKQIDKVYNKIMNSTITKKGNSEKTVMLTDLSRNEVVQDLSNILYVKGDGDYSILYLNETVSARSTIRVSHNLKYVSELISNPDFFRLHRSYLVNANYLEYAQNISSNKVKLKDGTSLPIARRRKREFGQFLQTFISQQSDIQDVLN